MMSKELELIKDMKILLECTSMGGLQRNADVLIGRAIELLAQPEQEGVYQKLSRIEDGNEVEILPSELWQDGYETGKRTMQREQEPVAWMNDSGNCFLSDGNKYIENWTALYTSPPKREPLSYDKTVAIIQTNMPNGLYDLARAIEKAHDIGVE